MRGGELEAAWSFCSLASELLQGIGAFMTTGIEQAFSSTDQVDSKTCRFLRDVRTPFIVTPSLSWLSQHLFLEAKLRASKALSFARVLRKSIEVSTQCDLNCPLVTLFDVLSVLHSMLSLAHHNLLSAGRIVWARPYHPDC